MNLRISPVFIAIAASITLLLSHLSVRTILANPENLISWLSSFGPFVILVYILIQAVTIVIPPLGGGLFVFIAVLAIFGPLLGLLLLYVVPLPLYCANFYLARRFGRPTVARLMGKKALVKIDSFAKDLGIASLVVMRIGGPFDYLSYAVGLTEIKFKTFLAVNILGGIPGTILSYSVLRSFDNLALGIVAVIATTYLVIGILLLFNYFFKKR